VSRRPQDLLFTLYGEFLLRDGPVWVGSLIALLEPLGLAPGAVRTTLSRMVARGWLYAERDGRRSYYALSDRGRRLLEEGEARIYRPEHSSGWDGEWTLLAYSIPEELRSSRDRLRVRLSWLGFGSLGNGLWISPHDVAERVRQVGAELGLTDHLELFRGRHTDLAARRGLVSKCWDLPAINERYGAFIERHLGAYRTLRAASWIDPGDAYLRRFLLVHEYREFPLLDPFLPVELQPDGWAGECSLALFQAFHALLAEPADRHLASVVESLASSRTLTAT
jgi:phenylacetic acid degradation operon negative regulatory protein